MGSNADIEDWLRLQRFSGVLQVVLRDSRGLTFEEAKAFEWASQPWTAHGFLTLLQATNHTPSADAGRGARHHWGHTHDNGNLERRVLITAAHGDESHHLVRHPPDAKTTSACRSIFGAREQPTCRWMAGLEAPFEQLVSREAAAAGSAGGSPQADWHASEAVPHYSLQLDTPAAAATLVHLGVVHFAKQPRRAEDGRSPTGWLEVPPRPLGVRATQRAAHWAIASCSTHGAGAHGGETAANSPDVVLCVDEAHTAVLERVVPVAGSEGIAAAAAQRLILRPGHDAVARVYRYWGAQAGEAIAPGSWVEDGSARRLHEMCERAGDAAGPHAIPAAAGRSWLEHTEHALTHGDGVGWLRGGLARSEALALRETLLRALPPEKQSTRVFANHMCQIHRGVPESAGLDPACEPLAPELLALPVRSHAHVACLRTQSRRHPPPSSPVCRAHAMPPRPNKSTPAPHGQVREPLLALARRMLGDGAILHNSGLSLVSSVSSVSSSRDAVLAAHVAHQDLPVNGAAVWGGRVPPPTHPLSLQALWLLDDFTYDNGATYVLPRTHTRAEHVQVWARSAGAGGAGGGSGGAASGILPARILTGAAGDVLFAMGSLWHAPSTSSHGSSPRLALLFEYAPPFVQPRDLYAEALLRRHLPSAEARAIFPRYEHTCPSQRVGGEACDVHGDVVSIHEWYTLARQRPHCLSVRSRVVVRSGGLAIPLLGLGTGGPDDDPAVIAAAIRAGYRLIDTGELYGNEEAIRQGVALSGVHAASLVLSSKAGTWCRGALPPALLPAVPAEYRHLELRGFYPTPRGTLGRGVCIGDAGATRAAFNASLARLGVRRLGLYLLHWPLTHAAYALDDPAHAAVRLEAWRELCNLKRDGAVAAVWPALHRSQRRSHP